MKPDRIILREIAVVIVGQTHNPSILNPDFLRHHDIVPEGLVLAAPPISTPAVSQVAYKGGLQVVSELNRVSFAEKILDGQNPACPGAARRYLRTVPLVHYTAVGVNPVAIWDAKGSVFPAGLLKAGKRMQFGDVSPSAEVKLTYGLAGETVNLTVKTEVLQTPKGVKEIIAFHGNFHHDIKGEKNESHTVAHAIVGKWEKHLEDFRRLTEHIAKEMKE